MRPIWTGAIGFGLVNIPVKLYSATESSALDFDMLDKRDKANIKYRRVNEKTRKEVAWRDIVKGFKYRDRYVVLTKSDFEGASARKSKVIEITAFLDESNIDTIYYETPYYLEPDKSGSRAYGLLRDAFHLPAKTNAKSKELGMAVSLVNQLTDKVNLASFKDTYSGELMKMIRAKAKGTKVAPPKLKLVPRKTEDLMSQLRDSLDAKKKKAG